MLANYLVDVLIVGAGPAGMAAALAAAPSGAKIVLLDENVAIGGQIWRSGPGAALTSQAQALRESLLHHINVQVLVGMRVVGEVEPGVLLLEGAEDIRKVRFKKLILCTGAKEQFVPFPGWTLPGVTGAGGLQALIKQGLPVSGKRVVIAGSGPLLLAAARCARDAGAKVLRVAEQASASSVASFGLALARWPAKAIQAVALFEPTYRTNSYIVEVDGDHSVKRVRIQRGPRSEEFECDLVACGFGLVPNVELGQMLGCALTTDRSGRRALLHDAQQESSQPGIYVAGECTGFGGSERALVQGAIAGHAAVGEAAAASKLTARRRGWDEFASQINRAFALRPELRSVPAKDTILCRCERVPLACVADCVDWRSAKLSSRCGMGPCQGRVCGPAAEFLFGWVPSASHYPLLPTRISTLVAASGGHGPSPACEGSPR
ncbi:FAD-dependent oxidoreductase [Variovorax sp. HW608]|uniref:FAD-dependent oxidoreductase n=1 Tax=Variovorax sp. HW608 TaxID=1034889 RepID=UPI003FCD2687